ncbi:MAG: hypothetical protein MUP16_01945 [Sedimentisphaerales bacterium]|nr:hypothetical protein [Sedimentisphaerales bacterium]
MEWYTFNFKISWPEGEGVKWWVDIFIVDCIVREVLSSNASKILLWRIHRRAYPDGIGHEFAFECQTDESTREIIKDKITKNSAYKILEQEHYIEKFDLKEGTDLPDGVVTTGWLTELQNAWPYYIHGVCEMFLILIEQLRGKISDFQGVNCSNPDIKRIEVAYKNLHNELIKVWQQYGQSAFLHHLNAIFAYEPVYINPPQLVSFPNVPFNKQL